MSKYKLPKVNYIGNKNELVEWIGSNIPIKEGTIMDLFAGGGSVSYYLKQKGYRVISNDGLYSSFVINKSIVENNKVKLDYDEIKNISSNSLNKELRNNLSWLENKLFYPEEVDELSKYICYSINNLEGYKRYLLQALIRRAMIRKLPYSRMNVDWNNIQKLRDEDYSYKKYGRRRAYHNKTFEHHILDNLLDYNESIFSNNLENLSINLDCLDALDYIDYVDLVYLDPPYPGTMNNYEGFYGAFDKIFNKGKELLDLTKKDTFLINFEKILNKSLGKTKYILLSLNSNTDPNYKEIKKIMKKYGDVDVKKRKHNYQLTGKPNKNKNDEILLLLNLDF